MSEEIAVIQNEEPVFDGIAFLSKIEIADTISKKISILNNALKQEPLIIKNMMQEMKKKGLNAGSMQDYDYIPVGVVEESLRQIFFRQIDFEIKHSSRDLNSFIVVATLTYKCLISQEMRKIDGIGAKALQQDSGSKVQDFNFTMKANALELGVGIAYSRAIKNAAKKLGKMFGGSLNRDEEIESVVVFNKGVMAKTDSDHKKMADLFELKKDFIPANDFDGVKNVIDSKLSKSYPSTRAYLENIIIPE
jgi:hypothetical protein